MFKITEYASIATFQAGSKAALKNYADATSSVAARVFAAVLIERLRLPSSSVEKVVDVAFQSIGVDALEEGTRTVYRSKATSALRHLAATRETPKADGGTSEEVIMALVQTCLDRYTLNGLAKADKARRDEASAPKKAAKQALAVAEAEAVHQANVAAREDLGLAADDTFDALAFQRAVQSLLDYSDANSDTGVPIEEAVLAMLQERRDARMAAAPVESEEALLLAANG